MRASLGAVLKPLPTLSAILAASTCHHAPAKPITGFVIAAQAVAKKSERLAFSGSIRYSTRIKLQQAGGGFRQTLNEAHCPRRRAKDLCE